ncbi:MAG: hypothetical protein ABIE70_11885 [bacterium]
MKTGKCVIMVLVIGLASAAVMGSVPSLISYQGRLTNAADIPVADGTYDITFAMYPDSLVGSPLWAEAASVTTRNGLFTHLLGSSTPLGSDIWTNNEAIWLQLLIGGSAVWPRTRLASAAYAQMAANLEVHDDSGRVVLSANGTDGGEIRLSRPNGDSAVVLHSGYYGDSSVVLPDSSINADEILDEPGFTLSTNVLSVPLIESVMSDLAVIEIETPADGYIVLDGKCYVVLEGTTGPNVALVQIDEEEGGTSQFPYYTLAGLNGYVDSGENFFPIHVTRIYYKDAGQYTFRMEGRASSPPPAQARTWDHVLRATFIPTHYGFVSKIVADPTGYPAARSIRVTDPMNPNGPQIYYEVDMRYEKDQSRPSRSDEFQTERR